VKGKGSVQFPNIEIFYGDWLSLCPCPELEGPRCCLLPSIHGSRCISLITED